MMPRTLPRSPLLAACVLLGAVACSKEPKGTTAQRAEAASGEIQQKESLKATVKEVDPANRTITLQDEAGHPFSVEVSENVALDRIRPDDTVNVTYQESVAFALQDKSAAAAAPAQPAVEQSTRRIPDGVQFGRRIETTVEILAVSEDGSHATFRGPEGGVRTVYVADAPNQEKVSHLRPGDAVAVTYTEKLAIALDQARD